MNQICLLNGVGGGKKFDGKQNFVGHGRSRERSKTRQKKRKHGQKRLGANGRFYRFYCLNFKIELQNRNLITKCQWNDFYRIFSLIFLKIFRPKAPSNRLVFRGKNQKSLLGNRCQKKRRFPQFSEKKRRKNLSQFEFL